MTKKFRKVQFDREAIKRRGFIRFLNSWKYSFQGLAYSYRYEQSFLIHTVCTLIVVVLGIYFRIKALEWLFLFISFGIILAIELINTAIEAAVDLTTSDIHPLAKIAKDCGSAATFVVSIIAGVVAAVIFIPYFMLLFK